MKLYLLRHAHSVANMTGKISCKLPGEGLSELGVSQAKEVADKISKISNIKRVYCSPFQRAIDTIKYQRLPSPYLLDERLKELDYGNFDGKSIDQVAGEIDETMRLVRGGNYDIRFGAVGENQRQLISRIYGFLADVISMNENSLAVTHECVVSIIARLHRKIRKYEKSPRIDNAQIVELVFEPKDIDFITEELKQYISQ